MVCVCEEKKKKIGRAEDSDMYEYKERKDEMRGGRQEEENSESI